MSLRIITALTLEKPQPKSELERRFLDPVIQRLFGGYPELAYAKAQRADALPPNVQVNEFFFQAGAWLGQKTAQQNYIAADYTHAAGYVLAAEVNVVAQLVAPDDDGQDRFSLSCNPDLTLDLLAARAAGKASFRLVAEVNDELPFMPGESVLPANAFSHVLVGPAVAFPLFAPPKRPVGLAEHAIGLHLAGLVPDGGTLQIGIGSIGDALAHGLILRHRANLQFKRLRADLAPAGQSALACHEQPFATGLYGMSEMFVDCFIDLAEAGVLKRAVDGAILHAGFFLGPRRFYERLRRMPPAERARFRMVPISFVNQLYGDEAGKRAARRDARFVNNAMMATLLGAVVSDGLEDGRIVSGVGGQHNFVVQAFALEGGRSIIALNATRRQGRRTVSNIRWRYGRETIPGHLRDIVVTEYGIADLRGRSDRDVIEAMLKVADARFQPALLAAAKAAGKIESSYQLPAWCRTNTPARLRQALAPGEAIGLLPRFPFGSDFTAVEQRLMLALERLQAAGPSPWRLGRLLLRGLGAGGRSADDLACLARMGLARPDSLREQAYRALLLPTLRADSGRSQRRVATPLELSG